MFVVSQVALRSGPQINNALFFQQKLLEKPAWQPNWNGEPYP